MFASLNTAIVPVEGGAPLRCLNRAPDDRWRSATTVKGQRVGALARGQSQ
jgi:hypothetical protein